MANPASKKAQVLLVGSGGVGTIAALNLKSGGQAIVTIVLRSSYKIVVERGFDIESVDHGNFPCWRPDYVKDAVPSSSDDGGMPFDYVICAMKNIPDVGQSIPELIRPAVAPGHTVIVLIQNGLNIERPFFETFPSNIVLSGVSQIDSHEIRSGVIWHGLRDKLFIGPFHNPNLQYGDEQQGAQRFFRIYSAAGKTECIYSDDVSFRRWQKLVYNAVWNPVCALSGVDTGNIRLMGGMVAGLVRPAMLEIVKTANALGYKLGEDVIDETIEADPINLHIKPSMLLDSEKESAQHLHTLGQLIEFENLVGEPLRVAAGVGIPTPRLETIYQMCRLYQWKTQADKASGRR